MNKIPKEALMSKSFQATMDKRLKEVIKVIKGYNYAIADGTLLGYVRNKNYIPWDDDIDIHLSLTKQEIPKLLKDINGSEAGTIFNSILNYD